jgi:hypothetical protein
MDKLSIIRNKCLNVKKKIGFFHLFDGKYFTSIIGIFISLLIILFIYLKDTKNVINYNDYDEDYDLDEIYFRGLHFYYEKNVLGLYFTSKFLALREQNSSRSLFLLLHAYSLLNDPLSAKDVVLQVLFISIFLYIF